MASQSQRKAFAIAIGVGLLVVPIIPASAQTAPNTTNNATTAPNAATTNAEPGPTGRLEKYNGLLRASELNGATVYNDQGTSIGTINDMLVDDSGKVQNVVISVGGFLGLGTRYVAVPFGQLKVEPSREVVAAAPAAPNRTATNPAAGPTAVTTPPANVAPGNLAAANAPATQYYSAVLPDATKDSLTKMPEFHYRG